MKYFSLLTCILGLCLSLTSYAASKETAGVSEVVMLLPDHIKLDAKFDTGADNSSLDARDIEFFDKNGVEWVRFKIVRSLNNKTFTLEYPVIRTARIVSRVPAENSGKSTHRRPVINMDVCIGNERRVIEVNLFNRSNFTYPFLLGSSGLAEFDYVVDVEANHLLPVCTAPK